MAGEPIDVVIRHYRVDPRRIVLLKSLLEGHEGLVVFRTADPREGIIELLISPDFLAETEAILADLRREIWIEPVDS